MLRPLPANPEDAVRIVNTISRTLRIVQRARASAAAAPGAAPSLAEYIASRGTAKVSAPKETHQRGPHGDVEDS
jgi:hypothetical protein